MVPVEENLPELLAIGMLPSLFPSLKKQNKKQTGFHATEESILITDLFVIGED